MTVTYYVNQKNIDATYGKNVGAQYIPICAGTFKLVNGVITLCDPNATNDTSGWPTDEIDSSGRFTGAIGHAVCRSDGRYWGIVPSFQNKTDPALGPQDGLVGKQDHRRRHIPLLHDEGAAEWDYKGGN